ncbi:hypothetical protein ACA910_012819 [Epithemia clementina (nom. ined.)]
MWISNFCVVPLVLLENALAFSPASWNLVSPRRRAMPKGQDIHKVVVLKSSASAISSNEDLLPGIASIDRNNEELFGCLEALREAPYFRFFSVDILASCEYMPQELFECYTEGCEILPVDEDQIPENIRDVDKDECEFELDGWARWDMPTDDYYDIQEYNEGYTGYDGSDVWNFIHERICFEGYDYSDDHWKADFNKVVSGLHSLISAQVIRGIQEKIDNGEPFGASEVWTDPRAEFNRRLSRSGETPLAIENLYFLHMLLLTAVSKSRDRLLQDCSNGRFEANVVDDVRALLDCKLLGDSAIGVAAKKLHDHATKDSDSVVALWEARMRTRELTRIMNCVQCNKCRLHGKISTMGVSTALQLLVGKTGEGEDPTIVHRVELATLLTTLHKCSRAIQYCQFMQR